MVRSQDINLASRGIDADQAKVLSASFSDFLEDWEGQVTLLYWDARLDSLEILDLLPGRSGHHLIPLNPSIGT